MAQGKFGRLGILVAGIGLVWSQLLGPADASQIALLQRLGLTGAPIDPFVDFLLSPAYLTVTLFLFAYVSLLAGLYLKHRIVNSRFGLVIQGAKDNDTRMRTLGYNTYAYRLVAYVISGAMTGFAGALLGNFTGYISPAMMSWPRSGELMFMVILGGAGSLFGPVFGAIGFLVAEEYLSTLTVYWQLPFGLLLIAAVLFARGGMWGFLGRLGARR